MPSVRLPEYELADLFGACGVWRGLDAGMLRERLQISRPGDALLPARRGIVLHESTGRGTERARVHYVECPVAGVIGRWPSALRIGAVTLYRVGRQQRPTAP